MQSSLLVLGALLAVSSAAVYITRPSYLTQPDAYGEPVPPAYNQPTTNYVEPQPVYASNSDPLLAFDMPAPPPPDLVIPGIPTIPTIPTIPSIPSPPAPLPPLPVGPVETPYVKATPAPYVPPKNNYGRPANVYY